MAKKSKGYGNYKGKKPYGTVSTIKDLSGMTRYYSSTQKTAAQGTVSSSAWLNKKKTFSQAKTLSTTNNGASRNPFGTGATDSQGDAITGETLVRFGNCWLGHDGNFMQMYPSSSDASSDDYSKFVLVNEEYGWSFTFDTDNFPAGGLGKMISVNAPTKVTIVAGADGYCQNRASATGRGSVDWNSSDVITDTTSTHYYTTQDTLKVSAVKAGIYWYCARTLLWFDTSTIPSGKTIKKAKVRLKLKSHAVAQTDYGEILKIYEWDEFAPGGRITGVDFDGFDITGGIVDMTNVSNDDWIEFDITGDLLTNFQSNYSAASPSHGYGFMIRNRYDFDGASLTPTGINYHWFYSADHSTTANRPQLVVSYD